MDVRVEKLAEKMRSEGLPEIAIEAFVHSADFVANGGETLIREADIEAVDSVPVYGELANFAEKGQAVLGKTVVIKLNGGLGTSMGLSKAKSLLPVRDGLSFLDVIVRQVLHQQKTQKVELPLVLMNSYRTQSDSLAVLDRYPKLAGTLPVDFLQHKVPRILKESFSPVQWPEDESLEWCPPGHGDLYIAMASSGMLEALIHRGYRYCFVSNADNLGAVLDPSILGWMASEKLPFVMEVASRTEADKKGGHLARNAEGDLMLREVAQCPEADRDAFQDIQKHKFFNTNNLWLDLFALRDVLASSAGFNLPVMCNEKPVSAHDADSPRCYQLETAMGAAISMFQGSKAVEVPRSRFAPVKTSNDLLMIWSDAYEVTEDHRVVPVDAAAQAKRVVDLDPAYFGKIDDLMARFPEGAPSLAKCERLVVIGDHQFESDIEVVGSVELSNTGGEPVTIQAGTVLD
ncbi:MAG: UTP--glucose-1-phosphate uridylyltransferase [Myxococcota bacterium]|jgi:UTP--glucose-1-phosphate uridylyltransferase